MFRITLPALLTLCAIVLSLPLAAGQQTFVLREYLGRQWDRELLTYPVSFKPGECLASATSLSEPGKQGLVWSQLIEVELWPGTEFVKSAKLAFVADLAPLATHSYALTYGTTPIGQAMPLPAPPDLKIAKGEGSVEITTSQFGLRMLLGDKTYDPPISAAEAPGPVVAIRTAQGEWYGGSRMYGPGKLTQISARLVDPGPAVAGVEVTYKYEGDRVMTLRVRLAEGNKQAIWELNGTPYDRDLAVQLVRGVGWNEAEKAAEESAVKDGWELLVSPGVADLGMLVPNHPVVGARWQIKDPPYYDYNSTLWVDVPVDKEPAGPLLSFEPWAGWWEQIHQNQLRFASPAWGQFLQMQAVDPGDWVEPGPL